MPPRRRDDDTECARPRRRGYSGIPWLWLIPAIIITLPFLFCCVMPTVLGLLNSERAATRTPMPIATAREEPKKLAIKINDVRVENWINPEGSAFRVICADWTNTGNRPIRSITAYIRAYNADHLLIREYHYTIYATANAAPGIRPGESYVEPTEEGFKLPNLPELRAMQFAQVVTTEISESGY